MIPQEVAQKHLAQFAFDLHAMEVFAGYSPAYNALAELIIPASYGVKRRKHADLIDIMQPLFAGQADFNPWTTAEGQRLATALYGGQKAPLLPAIWDSFYQQPFQSGQSRRPFRQAIKPDSWKEQIYQLTTLYTASRIGFIGLSVEDCARYSGYIKWQSNYLAPFFAAVLSDKTQGPALRLVLADILQGEDEVGVVSQGIIRGLLLSPQSEDWGLVEQLLLAAQRQEGLRQTILECLDMTTPGALRHIIGVILEHDLARFSSVVRAVDVWFGLSWQAPKKATVNRMLTLAKTYLDDPATVEQGIRSNDSLEVYVALWSVALTDVDEAVLLTTNLLLGNNRAQRLTSLYFLTQAGQKHPHIMEWLEGNFGHDSETDYWGIANIANDTPLPDVVFTACLRYGKELPKEGRSFHGTVFNWLDITVTPEYFYGFIIRAGQKHQLRALCENLAELPSDVRRQLVHRVLPGSGSWYGQKPKAATPESLAELKAEPWKRELIRQAARDRNQSVMSPGLHFLGSVELEPEDKALIIDLLKRKQKELRAYLILIVLAQPEDVLEEMTSGLLTTGSLDQRLAGLEVLSVLHEENRLISFVLASASKYQERSTLHKNEKILLQKLEPTDADAPCFTNGFSTIDFANLSPLIQPELKFGEYTGHPLFAKLVDVSKISGALEQLLHLLEEHGAYEYEAHYQNGTTSTVLLENVLLFTAAEAYELEGRRQLEYLPLATVWLDWYDNSGLNDFELLYLQNALWGRNFNAPEGPFASFRKQYFLEIPDLPKEEAFWQYQGLANRAAELIVQLSGQLSDWSTIATFQVDLLEDMIARFPDDLKQVIETTNPGGWTSVHFWCNSIQHFIPGGLDKIHAVGPRVASVETAKRLWELQTYLTAAARSFPETPNAQHLGPLAQGISTVPLPAVNLSLSLHAAGEITDDDLLVIALQQSAMFELLAGKRRTLNWTKEDSISVPTAVLKQLATNLLALELERGDLPTDASVFVQRLNAISGMDYLFQTLERLDKDGLERGYYYSYQVSRRASFSHIVKHSLPAESETVGAFAKKAKQSSVPRSQWFEVAMYAPQWAPWIGEYLRLPHLEVAVWWFHAHASDYMSPQKEKVVAQLSPILKEDFAQGAIDVDWFYAAYEAMGKRNWRHLHAAAKYISDGNGHRQVKTYSSVMLGEIKITETIKKIKEKRDKVFVKALGLIPFSRTNPEKDVLRRYNLLQEFARQSKQFGAQRQESEKAAVRIGLDNLARNAGHDDSTRFSWIMEAEATRTIMRESIVIVGDTLVQLIIDADGKPELKVVKKGKPQKTIPAKMRKHKLVQSLKEHKANLRRQHSRTRKSLEHAMLAGTTFKRDDLRKICLHPIVQPMLAKLVVYVPAQNVSGFWRGDQLFDLEGRQIPLVEDDQLVIAHPSHLFRDVSWDLYQRFAFEEQLVQPFKQIFRELYVITADERETANSSYRYQGHQIQPRKAVALLRSRGWTTSDTEGLQYVDHQRDLVATMYAMADWYSPSDVEAPTIEGVGFRKRNGKVLQLTEIDPILFSEVMRDIDLVVSVAHVGGVDPEASHSTLEMRAALARESARLFKLDNVTIQERHLVVAGTLGRYNIHLGSGVVSKGGLQLSIIPVQSQHRGRIFLPFLDDDPKSAEIISKMRLLARDQEIKDPTVLDQLMI